MAVIILNGKQVEIPGVNITKLVDASNGGNLTGVSGYIRTVVDGMSAQGEAISIVRLEDMLVAAFPTKGKVGEPGYVKGLPEGQARQRINNLVKGSGGKYAKKWGPENYEHVVGEARMVYNVALIKAWEEEQAKKALKANK